ncbi:MAG: FecR domain-containing protein [Novosphingobium sp.]|nr:FecR domain-containing protein [Novosphingobium sp.]
MARMAWTPPGEESERGEAARAWYLRLASGEATNGEVAALRAWLASDPANEQAFSEARTVWKRTAELAPEIAIPAPIPLRRERARRWQVAGGFATAFGALALFLATPSLAWMTADRASPVGKTEAFTLPDGTQVMLDTDSAIDLAFSDNERRVELVQGQLWVAVAPDVRRPFVVEAGDATIRDIGTAFSVRRGGDGLLVDVDQGLVEIATAGNSTRLAASQRGRFSGGHVQRSIQPENDGAWRHGRLIFEGQRLDRVLKEVDRYQSGRIVLMGGELGSRRVTAILDLDHLDGGLDALATTGNLRITRLPWLTLVAAR